MHAAIVTEFDRPPQYRECAEPTAGPGQQVMDVVAAAPHPRVRSQADGSHYTSTGVLPLVPGVDAVVRDRDGRLRYALLRGTASGSFADHVAVDERRSVPLPGGTDPLLAAAAINPVMSAWVALRRRIEFRPGSSVLVLGATGAAGRTALRTAKSFGAGEVIGAGRDEARLAALAAAGADQVLRLDQLAQAADVDVVLDYVWGEPAAAGMSDIIRHRRDRDRPLTWVAIGSVSGADSPIPSAALRAARLQIVGSGIGSVPGEEIAAEIPAIVAAVADGDYDLYPVPVPLAEVEDAWSRRVAGGERIVFVPER